MTDFTDSCVLPDVDKFTTRLVISPRISADLASQSVSLHSVPDADDDELKQVDRFHGHVLEKTCTCENKSSGNANIKPEVGWYQICNKETRGKSDPDTNNDHYRCGMPEDMLFDILIRLPVVSLVRLRCVCKSWCGLIDSSTFIAQHFDRNRGKEDSLIAVEYSRDDDSSKLCLLSGSKYEVYTNLECKLEWNSFEEVNIGNCCNGIVCLVNHRRGIADLWNPALKQKKRVPESSVSPQSLVWSREYHLTYGFGYDVKSDDYKVVKIHFITEYANGLKCRHNGLVEVYSLKGDSWKIMQDALPVEFLATHHMPWETLSMNGKCYWIGHVRSVDRFSQVFVSFDLNGETFETMALPGEDNAPLHSLDLLGGKLVCIKEMANECPYDRGDPVYYQIWVLEDEDGPWTKVCELGPTGDRWNESRSPEAFSRNGEFLLFTYSQLFKQLYLYNFATGEDGYVEIQDPNPVLLSFDHYTESLVPLNRLNCSSAY